MPVASESELSQPSAPVTSTQIFLEYYEDNEIFLSLEGVLKILSFVACVLLSVLFSWRGECAEAAALGSAAAAVALLTALALTALVAARALRLPACAPQSFFYTEVVSVSSAGAALLVAGTLSLAVCRHFVHGSLAIVTACTLWSCAAAVYSAAMRRWEVAVVAAPAPPPAPADHDV